MDSKILKKTKDLCKLYNIKPKHKYGQNFLISEEIYNRIIKVSDLKTDDIVLEVGPGLGFLTNKLSKICKKVISVELDKELFDILEKENKNKENIEFINQNILDFNQNNFFKKYKIVANLPYKITSVFLRKFLSNKNKPESMVLMLQKEVAERIVASPPNMSLLSLSVQFYAKAEICFYVNKNNFYPEPKVDSAVIKIELKKQNKSSFNEKKFFQLLKIGFSAKRKMLKNNLSSGLHLKQEKIEESLKVLKLDIKVRAQELSLDNWKELYGLLKDLY